MKTEIEFLDELAFRLSLVDVNPRKEIHKLVICRIVDLKEE